MLVFRKILRTYGMNEPYEGLDFVFSLGLGKDVLTHEQLTLSSYVETSQLISEANPFIGFYMKGKLVVIGL